MGGTEAAGDWFAIGDLGTYCTHRTVALVRPFFGPLPLAPLSLSACLPACLRCDHRIARANSFIHSLSSIHSPTRDETALGMCWRVWSYALGPRCLTRRGDGVGRVGFYSHLRFVHVGCSVCIGRKQNAEMDNTAKLACCPWLTSRPLFCCLLQSLRSEDRHVPQVYGPMGVRVCLLGRLGTVAAWHT